ncbi:HNH endonuclease [Actinotalea sp. M2MS4P-6]|uniref:HNH endonuclease signature motif containing protein n=1 Tax=Actinotalea sp. M2MS4P-6 TaxID=2983762 RepID=UPI0021E3BD5C|nr:HNH endonuclease signature motif containing protein [Actinotalea sp. M2MS4P-6]MCV2396487.1 HNH endonuclease [Actinotalea sp. M2MS4P-6]
MPTTAGGAGAAASLTSAARALAAACTRCADWTAADRAAALRELERASGALAMARSRLLVAERDEGTAIRPGDRDLVAARARQARTGLGEARREIRLADALEAMPAVEQAVGDGRLPLAHADALARANARAGENAQRRLAEPETQAELVRMAERLPLRDFAAATDRMVARWDPTSVERDHAAQRAARFLILTQRPDGTHVRGRLDRVAGAALRAALDGMGIAPDAERSKEQADADALVAAVERGTSGTAGVRRTGRPAEPSAAQAWDDVQRDADSRVSGRSVRPTVCVLVPAETVAEVAARRAPTAETEPALLDDGTVLPMSELGRFLCDSEIGRLVLDADSTPLDAGRTERLFTAAQRRAIIVRDRGCGWNGCDVPAAYCEIHHIRWWDRDRGPTDLENGVLLCSHHHHTVHAHDLAITRLGPPARPGDGVWAEPRRYEFRDPYGRAFSVPTGDPVADLERTG